MDGKSIIEKYERRNQLIIIIIISVATIAFVTFIAYHFLVESEYKYDIGDIKFQTGAIMDNKVADKLESLIKK